ncbi:MAG: tetratricopeptide repeat protein, partial [Chloroflexota bacterium]
MNDNGRRRFGVLEGVFILMAAGYLFYALTASSNDPANMDSPPVLEESVATLIPNGEFAPPFSSVPTQGSTSTTMTPAVAVDGTAAKEPRPLPSATAQPTSVSPSTIRNDFDRAVRYTEIGDYTGAIIGFSETLSDEPENTAARIGRAQAYVALQMYTEGIQDFTAVHPDDRTAEQFVLLGDALYAAGILEDALFSYNTAIQTDNTIAAAYYGRGRIYADRERFDLAQDDLERASSMDDSNL